MNGKYEIRASNYLRSHTNPKNDIQWHKSQGGNGVGRPRNSRAVGATAPCVPATFAPKFFNEAIYQLKNIYVVG